MMGTDGRTYSLYAVKLSDDSGDFAGLELTERTQSILSCFFGIYNQILSAVIS